MHAETFIDFYNSTAPRIVVEMDEATLQDVRQLRDSAGVYLWTPSIRYPTMPGTFLGMPVSVIESEERFLQIGYLFPDGHRHAIEMELPKQENGK